MNIKLREYKLEDIKEMIAIWNNIVEEGIAFPQLNTLNEVSGLEFFREQTYCAVAEDIQTGEILGLYILHPNNIGRCGHLCNASYAVKPTARGLHIGEKLVKDCIIKGKENGFKILQFNAVVKTNTSARHLYEKLGFVYLGTIPKGFLLKNGKYEDICLYYFEL